MATVKLNVGGTFFTTTMATIQGKYPQSLFARGLEYILESKETGGVSQYSCTFIDRDPNVFRHVLNFMRDGKLSLPEDFTEHELLLREAEFYRVDALKEEVNKHKERQAEVLRVFADVQGHIYCVDGNKATIRAVLDLMHNGMYARLELDNVIPCDKYVTVDIRSRIKYLQIDCFYNSELNAGIFSLLFLAHGLKLKISREFVDQFDRQCTEWVFTRK